MAVGTSIAVVNASDRSTDTARSSSAFGDDCVTLHSPGPRTASRDRFISCFFVVSEFQQGQPPIILDDSYDLVETTAALNFGHEHHEDLLAGTDFSAALLSMSGYDKPQLPDISDYNASRPLQDPMYLAYAQAQPGYAQHQLQPSPLPYDRHADQTPYQNTSFFQPRSAYEGSSTPLVDFQTRHVVQITSYQPKRGTQGSAILVYIQSTTDLTTARALTVNLMFAKQRCPGVLARIDQPGPYYQYALSADCPPYSTTGSSNPRVALRMQLQDETGNDIGLYDIGPFTYTDVIQGQARASPEEVKRKRRISSDSADSTRYPSKRPSTQQLRPRAPELYVQDSYSQAAALAEAQNPQSLAQSPAYGYPVALNRSQSQQSYQQQETPRRISHHLSTSSASSQSNLIGPSPQTPSWSPSYSTINTSSKSPRETTMSVTRVAPVRPPSGTANPPLIRTSTLQQPPSPAATTAGASAGGSFNPYAMYPHKAVLKISGDLDSMADNWSGGEWDAQRRLVQFWRLQSGSTISTNFKPTAPEDRPPNSICISCIWWEEKKECFVTSVDTIYLLESLVALRFTVEEKNRIRRNLEGFRPLTVSKAKSDSEEFFKIIMGFPNPKPRNIEKDVKVFPWKILAHALKKIIGKYSASYSSTAGALLAPGNSTYGGGIHADMDHRPTASPRSASVSTASTAYPASLNSTAISPHMSQRSLSAYQTSGPPLMQMSVPGMAPAYTATSLQYNYTPHQEQMTASSGQMQASARGASWDYSSFLNPSPATASPSNAQVLQYQRISPTQEGTPTHYQMTRHPMSGP